MDRQHIIERAFQLAQTGECRGMAELHARLKRERYSRVEDHLAGKAIKQQLRDIFVTARLPL